MDGLQFSNLKNYSAGGLSLSTLANVLCVLSLSLFIVVFRSPGFVSCAVSLSSLNGQRRNVEPRWCVERRPQVNLNPKSLCVVSVIDQERDERHDTQWIQIQPETKKRIILSSTTTCGCCHLLLALTAYHCFFTTSNLLERHFRIP